MSDADNVAISLLARALRAESSQYEKHALDVEQGRSGPIFRAALQAVLAALRTPPDDAVKLREAAQALSNKLDVIHADGRYASVWSIAQDRIGPYGGPTYTDELAALRAALKGTPADEDAI